jgi:hypothetical protein
VTRALVLVFAACAAAPPRPEPAPPGPEALAGYWELADGSHVVMQVTLVETKATVEAWATDSGEHFEVTQVSWDGARLRATFRYPSTKTTTTSELALVNADRMEGTVTGPYTGRETWIRIVPGEASTRPAGANGATVK